MANRYRGNKKRDNQHSSNQQQPQHDRKNQNYKNNKDGGGGNNNKNYNKGPKNDNQNNNYNNNKSHYNNSYNDHQNKVDLTEVFGLVEERIKSNPPDKLILTNITTEKFKFQKVFVNQICDHILEFREAQATKIGKKLPKIEELGLSQNGLRNLGLLYAFANAFPGIKILHLEQNDIQDGEYYNDLRHFSYLQHVYIDPIKDLSFHAYAMDMKDWGVFFLDSCPSLKTLNEIPIAVSRTDLEIFNNIRQEVPKSGSTFDTNIENDAKGFFYDYIDTFDYHRERTKFTDFYNDTSILSLTVDRDLNLPKELSQMSRDLKHIRHGLWRHKLLIRGMNVPSYFHFEFPNSKHLGEFNQPQIIDAHALMNDTLISMVVHGQMELTNKEENKEKWVVGFDRHWLLVMRQGRIFIQNDHLNLRSIHDAKELDPENENHLILVNEKRDMLNSLNKYNFKNEILMSIVYNHQWRMREIEHDIISSWSMYKRELFKNNSKPPIQIQQGPPMMHMGPPMPMGQQGPPPPQQHNGYGPYQQGPPPQQQQYHQGPPAYQQGPPAYQQGPPPHGQMGRPPQPQNGYGPPPQNGYGPPRY